MDNIVYAAVEDYAIEHTSEVDSLYERLREETYTQVECPQMQVGRLEGRLLKLLTAMSGAKLAVEIGTFTGYSALSIAEGLPKDGKLIACDVNEETGAIARRYFDEASWGYKIEQRFGPALETLEGVDEPIDLAFIDADKGGYIAYWEALVPKLSPGGLILADNVLWSARVLEPQADSDKALAAFNAHVAADERMEQVMLTVRDGITLARRVA